MSMFCYQCEQTCGSKGCTIKGVCGKDETTAALQDVIIQASKDIAAQAKTTGNYSSDVALPLIKALFTTVTNVNFDPTRLIDVLKNLNKLPFNNVDIPVTEEAALSKAQEISIAKRMANQGEDVTALQELLTYGLKGAAAYADHAQVLGQEDPEIYKYFIDALAYLDSNPADVGELTAACLKCGEKNLRVMELLDAANTGTYGHPEPTQVRVTPVKGKAILVSGHELKDLAELLKQTEGKGINVYTHGEMLPCCAYPELKKYTHLVGNYGGAWQDQQKEFDAIPGAVLMTTNCIQKPRETYKGRIFTSGLVAWPGVTHISDSDFSQVIEAALEAEGFKEDGEDKTITIGFARNAVLGVADKVVDAVKQGAIKHFFLVGGCDGAKPGRNYYTEFAEKVPEDCVILTLACGKYRFNKLEFGDIGGIPRLLDIGQCNDAYSAIQIAVALAGAFDCGVNDLPLSMILSWYEQKAVVILLSLLHLGIKDIRLGPSLPAFITPAILQVLVDNFEIKPITSPEEDLKTILG